MRKNYFAKKFVAYSMAFAVAFSTLTVSPVFVKEAKAAGKAIYETTVANATANIYSVANPNPVDNGVSILGTVKTSNSTPASSKVTFAAIQDNFGESALINPGVAVDKITSADGLKYEDLTLKTDYLPSEKSTPVDAKSTGANTKRVIFNDKQGETTLPATDVANWYQLSEPLERTFIIDEGKTTEETITYTYYTLSQQDEATATLDLGKVTASSLGYYLADLGSGKGYELFNVIEDTDLNVVAERTAPTDTYKVVEGNSVDLKVNATSNKSTLTYTWKKGNQELKSTSNVCTIENVNGTNKGTYTYTVSDGVKTITRSDIKVELLDYVDYNTSDYTNGIQYTSVVKALIPDDGANKGKLSGGSVTLTSAVPTSDEYVSVWLDNANNVIERSESDITSYNASNNKTTVTSKSVYTGKEIKCYTILKADYDRVLEGALKEVAKATTEVAKFNKIEDLLAAEKEALFPSSGTATLKAISVETFKLLGTDDKMYSSENVVKSVGDSLSISGTPVTVGTNEVAYYDNASVSTDVGVKAISKTALQGDEFGVKEFFSGKYVKLASGATFNADEIYYKLSGSNYVVDASVTNDTTLATAIATGSYIRPNDKVISYNKLSGSVIYSGTTDYYKLDSNNDYVIDTAITSQGTLDAAISAETAFVRNVDYVYTSEFTKYVNVVYTPDLKVEASDVTAKIGEKVNLSVTATSRLPLDYTWAENTIVATKTTGMESVITEKDAKNKNITADITVKAGDIYQAEVRNADDEITKYEDHYTTCTVTNGIETKTVKIAIKQLGGFTFVDKDGKVQPSTAATTSNTKFNVDGIAGKNVKLAPVVTANEGTELTYAWFKSANPGTTPVSTEPSFTTAYSEANGTNKFSCVVADKAAPENKVVFVYTVKDVALDASIVKVDKIDAQVYTGKEIEPNVVVKLTTNFVGDLVKGTDYFTTFENNVNAGTARVLVTLSKELDPNQTVKVEATFPIDRADNELKVADKTVVLGGSVQPKTTNKAGAPVTYTYYADADCTTEIDVPSKVGTYYVKANAIATVNFNEATSNVATVKVVPGKVKMLGTSRTASSVKLNWNKTTGATSYRVFYKAAGAKSYKVFKNTTATSMNVTGLASATTYTFAVKAYAKTAGYSTVYATKQTTTAPAKVAKPSVTAGSKKATVKFTKVARATGYQVYMAKGNGSYKKVATTKSLSFTKTGLAKGATYKFKVRAYKTVGSNTYYGAFSSANAVVVK